MRESRCSMKHIGGLKSKVRGQLEPRILGWYFTMADEKEPIDTLVFECKGNSVGIHTNFRL